MDDEDLHPCSLSHIRVFSMTARTGDYSEVLSGLGKNNSTLVCRLASVGIWLAVPPIPTLMTIPVGTPRRYSSTATNSALAVLNESLMAGVPVELSAAPVIFTDRLYFFATRASPSRLSICEASVKRAVLRLKKK